MAAEKKKPTTGDAWARMRAAKLDDLVDEIDAMTDAEADALLDANGGDSAGTRKRADAQMAAIDATHARMGDWQAEARAKLDAARETFAAVRARRPKLSRAELEARAHALKTDARYAQPVATFFRKRKTEEMTDEELEALIDEVEALRELDAKKQDPK